jgi:hypothetical protein
MGRIGFKWRFYLNGEIISSARRRCITSLELSQSIYSADYLTVSVSDPKLLFMTDDVFVEDAKVHLDLYLVGDSNVVKFDGYITAYDPDFPQEGNPTMVFYCMDETHVMNKKKIKKTWKNKTRADVVKEVAKKYGFTCEFEKGYTFRKVKTITQSNITDIALLQNLASEEPDLFYCKLVGKVIHFKRVRASTKFNAFLRYRKEPYDVLSFSPQITKEQIEVKVSDSDIDPTTGDEYQDTDYVGTGEVNTGSNAGKELVYNRDTGVWEWRVVPK